MFKILCQLFIALTGSSLPEEIYDDKSFISYRVKEVIDIRL